ncbi:hypothetical protein GX50_03450 [[Emmonsia] crescens]|uniref:Uncharacterized protein n=1 Tax=[Emmonsia] crescens TaxID=73230 RepID=A0A2B7ZL38_9EURO|nr:hypothetical protein GX50_03450 [Emmonsia crescens]
MMLTPPLISATAEPPSASSAPPPPSASAQAPGTTSNDKPPSSSHSRRRLHPHLHPLRIHTQLNHYNALPLPDDSWLPRKQRHRHRHSLRHRDQNHLHTHTQPHLHPQQEEGQQQQPQQLYRNLLDTDPTHSKAITSEKEKEKEKRKYRHKRHVSRDVRFPRTVRDHASMSLRPGKHAHRDKGRGRGGTANGAGELGAVYNAAQRSETNGLDTSDSGSGTPEERLLFGRRKGNITMAQVRRERIRRMKEEESNRTALTTLTTLSTTITRRLDTTYYTLLEKIANLHRAIYSFHTLSTTASTLHSDFTHETDNLSRDTSNQIDEFHGAFASQIQRIESLEARMRAGSEKAAALNRRMEIVREKIEAWDHREGEWQRRVTTRLRIFWAVVGTAVVVLVVAWGVQQLRPAEGSMGKGIGIGIGDLGVGGTAVNVSTVNLTCGLSEEELALGGGERAAREAEDVWVSSSFETSGGGSRGADDTCSKYPLQG